MRRNSEAEGDDGATVRDGPGVAGCAALGLVWARGYTGPIVSQAYDLGGDAYLTAKRSIDYIREVHDRYQRNPVAEDIAWRGINLPSFPSMTDAEVRLVCDSIRQFCHAERTVALAA